MELVPFSIKVDLGERATVHTELAPTFSSSRVLHVRLALPVSLHVEPHKGVMQISKDGGGLHRGDVLRAFTSFSWRSSSVFGLIPLSVQPIRSLFVADGMPANRVFEALAANTEDRARDILLIVERQSMLGVDGMRVAQQPDGEPSSSLFPWL